MSRPSTISQRGRRCINIYLPRDLPGETEQLIRTAQMQGYFTLKIGWKDLEANAVEAIVLGTTSADTAERLRTWFRQI